MSSYPKIKTNYCEPTRYFFLIEHWKKTCKKTKTTVLLLRLV